jgi:hypothetical protein
MQFEHHRISLRLDERENTTIVLLFCSLMTERSRIDLTLATASASAGPGCGQSRMSALSDNAALHFSQGTDDAETASYRQRS